MKMRKRQQTRKGKKLVYEIGREYFGMVLADKSRYKCGQTKLTFLRPCEHTVTAHDGPTVLRRVSESQCAQCRREGKKSNGKRNGEASFWTRTGRHFSAKQRQRVGQMLRDGMTCGEIARDANCNRSSVRTIMLTLKKRRSAAKEATVMLKKRDHNNLPLRAKLNKRGLRALRITQRMAALDVEQTNATKEWENRERARSMERAQLIQELNETTTSRREKVA